MANRLSANPSYGILEEEYNDVHPIYEMVDQLHHQQNPHCKNASILANERKLIRNIRCLCCVTVLLGVVAVLALLTAVVAVNLSLLLNKPLALASSDSLPANLTEKSESGPLLIKSACVCN